MAADGLSRDQIVRAAIDLLDADGLDGLSMRRLGTRLGSGATSVYWHVGNKDNLVALAADAVFDEIDLPTPDDVGWRAALITSAHGVRAMIVRHRWLIPVLGTNAEVHGPHIARHQNHVLTACEAAGFTDNDSDSASSTVFAYVLGASMGEASWKAQRPPAEADEARRTTDLVARARVWAEPYPRLLARYDALAATDPDTVRDDSFEFGLHAVLDGLTARLSPNPAAGSSSTTDARLTLKPGASIEPGV